MAVQTTANDFLKLASYSMERYGSIYGSVSDVIGHVFFCIGNGFKVDKGKLKEDIRINKWVDIRKQHAHRQPLDASLISYESLYEGMKIRLQRWQVVYLDAYQRQLSEGEIKVSGLSGPFDHFDFTAAETYGVCAAEFEFLDANPEIKQMLDTYVRAARDFFAELYNKPELVYISKHHNPELFNQYLDRLQFGINAPSI